MVRTEVVDNGVAVTLNTIRWPCPRVDIHTCRRNTRAAGTRSIRVSRRVATRGMERDRIIKHPADQGVSVTPNRRRIRCMLSRRWVDHAENPRLRHTAP